MGYKEAKEDGIKSRRNPGTGETYYYPHCSECDTEVFSLSYIRGRKYTCKECKDKKYFTDKKKSIDRSNEAKERKFENALKRIQSVVGSMKMGEYETAIETVRKVLYRDGWFESTEEIMAAIELVKNNVRIRHQVKVNRYRADFVLPDQKIILEVDGHVFHTKETREKERVRDSILVLAFGSDWEVIHITDDRINEDITRLVPAIKKISSKRNFLRRKNKGQLPDWYTDRERDY